MEKKCKAAPQDPIYLILGWPYGLQASCAIDRYRWASYGKSEKHLDAAGYRVVMESEIVTLQVQKHCSMYDRVQWDDLERLL